MSSLYRNILRDLKVELSDEFDRNFERKAFFDSPWKEVRIPNRRGSLMIRSGALRRSIRASVAFGSVTFSSSAPQARILNEGGVIPVTAKMKKYFWAMYYKCVGGVRYNIKTRSAMHDSRSKRLTLEAQYWKLLALKKEGSMIKVEARRFIGHHAQVDHCIREVIDANFKEVNQQILKALKP